MSIELTSFWGSNHYENAPVTDDDIARAEAHFGRKLPSEYINLIRVQNGGYTQGFAFPTTSPTTWAEDHVPFDEMGGIVFGDVPMHSIMATDYMTEEWGLPPNLILLAGDGHTWIALDYRDGLVPKVTGIDGECEEERVLAESFGQFVAAWVPSSRYNNDDLPPRTNDK